MCLQSDYLRRWSMGGRRLWQPCCIATRQMLPSSHRNPMHALIGGPPPGADGHLADAFSAFIAAADRLEGSHRQLHDEVAQLRRELEERNRALSASLGENERMRVALRQILDALPCGVAVVEITGGRVVLLNPEGRRLIHAPSGELPADYSLPNWIPTALAVTCSGSREHGYEQEVQVESEGKQRWLAIRYSRMPAVPESRESELAQMIVIIRDVTEHKNAEQDRDAARNILALAEMSAILAHEIRNPLGSLELLTRCLAGDPGLSEESKQCVEHLQVGVRSLSATVSNVLRFHTPGVAPVRPLDLGSVLNSSVEFIRPVAKQKNVGLKLRDNLNQAAVAGDPEGLKQVLFNLFFNALRHTQPGGEIIFTSRIEPRPQGQAAVIECTDTGSGIAAENLPHIFDPGFTTTGSSGLGLAVCRRIVEQHQGKITVRSRVGHGTTFQVEIPV